MALRELRSASAMTDHRGAHLVVPAGRGFRFTSDDGHPYARPVLVDLVRAIRLDPTSAAGD